MADVNRSRSKVREVAAGLSMRPFHAVVANSQAAADEAMSLEGIRPELMHVIRNAVVPVEVPAARLRAWRQDWGDDGGRIIAGCIGSLRPGKGHDLLLDAAQDLGTNHPDLRFVFIGDGPLRAQIEWEIHRRALTGIVRLHTSERDARACYGALDIVVQASESEGLPNAVLEAAVSGKAIVATDVGGTREIIDGDVDGLLVPRADRQRLGDAISRLASDPQLRERLGRAASVKAAMFSTARLAEETGALYIKTVERRLASR
jgi:glycosyltransferase involved in cell wall biosynthesis